MLSLPFWYVRKACQKILKEFENLSDVRFVQLERAVKRCPVVLVQFEIETVEVWNAAIHTLDHLVLKVKKGCVVEWNPDVADEGGGRVVPHRMET